MGREKRSAEAATLPAEAAPSRSDAAKGVLEKTRETAESELPRLPSAG
jgi:hypothetical protein